MARHEVLIAGAGPTGLVLALWLTKSGVAVRIVDKVATPGTTSRALAVQARTLELYAQLGIADRVVARGVKIGAANIWVRGEHRAKLPLGDIGRGMTPYPFALIYPQDEHEEMLIEELARAGVTVEREVELVRVDVREDVVRASLKHKDGAVEEVEATFLAGCDGARSFVRHALGVDFPGGTYEHLYYVADVEARGDQVNRDIHVALDDGDFLACFPLVDEGHVRLVGTLAEALPSDATPTFDLVKKSVIERLKLEIARVNWFSTYRVHHRVATSFRRGRAFLLGDASHVHSPVGGQGMNTGIGDAVNLAWKLAMVLRGRAPEAILDSYEAERVPFAEALVKTTDRAFELISSNGSIANLVRLHLVPPILETAAHSETARRWAFETVSQTKIEYRASKLNAGSAGDIHGGDRLPWLASANNFAPLATRAFQLHVVGEASAELRAFTGERALPLHVFGWSDEAARAGFERDACYLVRPDGYVAFAGAFDELARFIDHRAWKLSTSLDPSHA